MLIAISGKIGSGKDTVGNIIRYLTLSDEFSKTNKDIIADMQHKWYCANKSKFDIKKFADALKDNVCRLIGCTREQLEDPEFKNKPLGEDWIRYSYAIGHGTKNGQTIMWDITCTKEEYEEQYRINWQTAYKEELTPRRLLQLIGTQCYRDVVHQNIHVNATFAGYKGKYNQSETGLRKTDEGLQYPNWVITDMRFPNELEAVKKRGGISIRVNRTQEAMYSYCGDTYNLKDLFSTVHKDTGEYPLKTYADENWLIKPSTHESEIALDNAEFDYVIENNGTIEELVEKVKEVLIKEKII